MNCSKCGSPTYVLDSRPEVTYVRRRRQCSNRKCRHRFNTEEFYASIEINRCEKCRRRIKPDETRCYLHLDRG